MGALVAQYGWANGTLQSRKSKWAAYLQFCLAAERCALPMNECTVLSFIGWLAD